MLFILYSPKNFSVYACFCKGSIFIGKQEFFFDVVFFRRGFKFFDIQPIEGRIIFKSALIISRRGGRACTNEFSCGNQPFADDIIPQRDARRLFEDAAELRVVQIKCRGDRLDGERLK